MSNEGQKRTKKKQFQYCLSELLVQFIYQPLDYLHMKTLVQERANYAL
jgi:hypothetical protein